MIKISSLQKGLVGHWPLDIESLQSTTTFADKTPNGNMGTSANTPVFTTDRMGQSDRAMSFNGTSDWVETIFTFQPTQFSISWWTYPLSLSDYNQNIGSINGDSHGWNGFAFHTTTNGSVYVGVNTGTRLVPKDLPAGTIIVNEWQNFIFIFNNGDGTFYKNDVLLASKSGMANPIDWGGIHIGKNASNDTINGSLADFRIYNRALSQTERTQLYELYRPKLIIGA